MADATQVIAASLLDTWIAHDWSDGIQLASLKDLTEIHIRTRNSIYEIIVIDHQAGEILIRGGRFFAAMCLTRTFCLRMPRRGLRIICGSSSPKSCGSAAAGSR